MIMKRLCLSAAFWVLAVAPSRAAIDGALVARLKRTVVNVQRSWTVGINSEGSGRFGASGFIVDAKRGIIATNHHVAGSGPSVFKIVFENGQSTEARLLHYDAWHDFAFLKIDPAQPGFPLQEVSLGDSSELQEQDDVVMIGNNDVHEYSVKFGKVSNLVLNKGQRHSAALQTTFDRAGGSSGSPVFDAHGKAVAIHFGGTETTSFELKINYLKDALARLQAGEPLRRGDAGLALSLLLVSDAQKHFHLPDALARKVLALRPKLKYMISVGSRIPGTPASERFLPGDQILAIDGTWIGDDLYRFDRIVDDKVGGEVEIQAVRAGSEFTVKLPVRDAEALKARRFARFAGGVLQDLTPELRLLYNLRSDGVFLSEAEQGSSLAALGRGNVRYLIVIEGVNGTATPDLDAFVKATKGLRDRENVYFIVQDKNEVKTDIKAVPVTLDLKYSPLEVSEWSPAELDWVKKAVDSGK